MFWSMVWECSYFVVSKDCNTIIKNQMFSTNVTVNTFISPITFETRETKSELNISFTITFRSNLKTQWYLPKVFANFAKSITHIKTKKKKKKWKNHSKF